MEDMRLGRITKALSLKQMMDAECVLFDTNGEGTHVEHNASSPFDDQSASPSFNNCALLQCVA